jgi:hypothetical protein
MVGTAATLRSPRPPDTAGLEVALLERALSDGGILFCKASPGFQCFYRLTLQPTLFGGLDLVREWGRLAPTQSTHHRVVEHHERRADVLEPLAGAIRVRLRYGYRARALPARFVPSAPVVLWCPRPA